MADDPRYLTISQIDLLKQESYVRVEGVELYFEEKMRSHRVPANQNFRTCNPTFEGFDLLGEFFVPRAAVVHVILVATHLSSSYTHFTYTCNLAFE